MPNLGTKKQVGGREGQDHPVHTQKPQPYISLFLLSNIYFQDSSCWGNLSLPSTWEDLSPTWVFLLFFSEVVFMLRYATKGGHRAGVHSPPFCPTTAELCNRRWQNWEGEGLHTIHLAKCRYIWYEHLPEALLSCCREQEALLGHNSCHPKAGTWNTLDEPSL